MSEQGKANFQAFGAGIAAFAIVVGVGWKALNWFGGKTPQAAPPPAAAPVDLSARDLVPAPAPASRPEADSAASPAAAATPEGVAPSAPALAPAASAPVESPAKLQGAAPHPMEKATTTARAEVKNTLPAKAEKAAPAPARPALKIDAAQEQAVAATVHYGASSRSELMGRAAGPVYNLQSGAKTQSQAAKLEAAKPEDALLAARKAIEDSALPAEEKAKALAKFDEAAKGGEKK